MGENNNFVEVKSSESKSFNSAKSNKSSFSFGRNVVLPFLSGVVGAGVILGVCLNVPYVKNNLFDKIYEGRTDSSANVNYNNVNTDMVSLSSFSDTGIYVSQKVLPSIVGISVEYSVSTIFSRATSTARAEGSGVIISNDGYILTNNHVINNSSSSSSSYYTVGEATKITVSLYNDETTYEAKVIGTDEQTDLAVIKIEKNDLTAAELGDSDSLQVGEWCMAIGNPLGMQSSVTSGSISALNRKITDSDGKTFTLVQTDAAINEGNSGGALVNSKGQVIGINTLKASGTGVEGLGFAIPINSTKSITDDLVKYNKVKRPYIGITGSDITESVIKQNPTANLVVGAYVRSIEDYSPAEKAGLKIGDIITKADNKEVKNMDELKAIIAEHKIGDTMSLTVMREGQEKDFSITLAEQP